MIQMFIPFFRFFLSFFHTFFIRFNKAHLSSLNNCLYLPCEASKCHSRIKQNRTWWLEIDRTSDRNTCQPKYIEGDQPIHPLFVSLCQSLCLSIYRYLPTYLFYSILFDSRIESNRIESIHLSVSLSLCVYTSISLLGLPESRDERRPRPMRTRPGFARKTQHLWFCQGVPRAKALSVDTVLFSSPLLPLWPFGRVPPE